MRKCIDNLELKQAPYREFWSRGYVFLKLNSADYEICPANKSQINENCNFFLAKHSWA